MKLKTRLFMLLVAATTFALGCGAEPSERSDSGEASLSELSPADIERADGVTFGLPVSKRLRHEQQAWTVWFDGTRGDEVHAEVWATVTGTASLYAKRADGGYAAILEVRCAPAELAHVDATLPGSGRYFLGFTAERAPASTSDETVRVMVGLEAPRPETPWGQSVREAYEAARSAGQWDGLAQPVSSFDLPRSAQRYFDQLDEVYGASSSPKARRWHLEDREVFVVEQDVYGDVSLVFFDEAGEEIASCTGSESTPTTWW